MNSKILVIDLHGFTRKEAKEYLYEELTKNIKKGIKTFKIIHGFNNGSVIKDWLKSSKDLKETFNVREIMDDPSNSGSTYIILN